MNLLTSLSFMLLTLRVAASTTKVFSHPYTNSGNRVMLYFCSDNTISFHFASNIYLIVGKKVTLGFLKAIFASSFSNVFF